MKIRKGYKKTEIGRIPEKWEVVRLGEVLSLEYGRGLTKNERENGEYPVYGSNGVIGYHSQYLIKGPGIIVGRKGSIGAITWSDRNFWPIDTTYYILLRKSEIDPRWLFYKLSSLNLDRLNMATGTPGLNRDLVYKLKLPLPPLPEQRKIAEILSTVDKAIEKVDEAIEKTERLKKGLMQNLLTNGIGHKEFKDTEIGRIPKEWEVVRLGDPEISEAIYYGITAKACSYKTGLKMLRTTDIKNFVFDYHKLPYCKITDTRNQISQYKLFEGDIIVARAGTVGVSVLVDRDYEDVVFGSYLIKVKPKKEEIYPKYIHYFFQSYMYWSHIKKAQGSTLKNINLPLLKSLILPLPPLPEQKKIAEILSTVDKRLELLKNKKEKLKRIKKGLMNDLLTGKMRVKV